MHITEFKLAPLEKARYVIPLKISYVQNGKDKTWEAIKSHDSVATLLFHVEKNAFLLVKQFRPPVYLSNPDHGITYELCAGILDKDIDPIDTAIEEIDEEVGYCITRDQIQKVTTFYTNVGISGAHQMLFYAQIDESMKIHDGGGIHDEEIELYYLPIQKAKTFALDDTIPKTPGLMFAFYWFFDTFDKRT